MDCDVGLLSSEIDVPKHHSDLKNIYTIYPQGLDGVLDSDNMGLENTWTDDEFVVPPIPDLPPIPLPAPSTSVDVTFEDSSTSSAPILEELDCLFSPVSQTNEVPDDPLLDGGSVGSAEPGVCGLRNLGNTCFMGAGIQCLMTTAPIAIFLYKAPNSPNQPLTNSFADLTRKMWSGRYPTLQPMQFKLALAAHYPQFNDFRQHDCQEFLALLLDGLHEQLNTASSKDIACQVVVKELHDQSNSKDASCQSTSKDETIYEFNAHCEESIMKELVSEVNQKKSNLNKSTRADSGSPEPYVPQPMVCGDKCDNLNCDKQINNKEGVILNRDGISVAGDSVQRITGLEDILKEAKTSNLNVLVTKQEANNELRFDSDKYPRTDICRRRGGETFNVNSLHLFDNNTCGKRNSSLSNLPISLDFKDGLDLKRVKLHSIADELEEKNKRMELERQCQSLDILLEKNERMECERKASSSKDDSSEDDMTSSLLSPNLANITYDKTSEVEADNHWQKHLAQNKSVVVNTFQGQFKSTVVCSVCKFISVTYEPFMYLSVPLPNAMQKKLKVTFIGESLRHPTEFLLELNKYDNVNYLRDQILIKVGCEVKGPIVIAEVFNHHIAKVLEEQLIRYLNDSERSLYAFEVTTLLDKTAMEPIDDSKVEEYLVDTCIICLEDKDTNMKQHMDCTCILCESCIAASCTHYKGTTFDCPVCRKEINCEEHLKTMKPQSNMTARMINIPFVFRVDTIGDGNNNQKNVELFGHPMLVRMPNHCTAEALKEAIATLIPYKEPYRLLLVDGQGLHCSRCMYHSHCRGCELPEEVNLSSSDTIAVAFSKRVKVLPTTSSLSSMSSQASSLTLYDCIQAFSQSEILDGNNPWFCPQCKKNRCATKTLSVWRYPDYLIVYLKRFVFHNQISTKLEDKVLFPLTGLSLATGSDYDLYACVCHIGGVSAGHYTTYAQHPYTHHWHYFNDSFVSKQSPLEEDYSNAYILFYKKQGLQPPPIDSGNGLSQ